MMNNAKPIVCLVTSMHPVFDLRVFKKESVSLAKMYNTFLVAANVGDQEIEGVHIRGFKQSTNRMKKMLSTKNLLNKLVEIDADIYHFHDPELLSVGLKMKKKGKKIIFDSHENYSTILLSTSWIPKPMRKLAARVYTQYERYCLKRYDAVISVTSFIVDRLKKINSETYQVTNYPLFHDVPDNREWGKSVCFAGGIDKWWMHHNIVKAIEKTNASYELAGVSPNSSYFDSLTQTKGWEHVVFRGKLQQDEVMSFMQKSSAGMNVSSYDDPNAGNKIGSLGVQKLFEYMMAGIPIICSDHDVWHEIITKNDCGICVDPNDINQITDAINYLINNPEEAKRMGDNAYRAVQTEYNWQSQEKELYKIYNKILNEI